MMNTKEIEPVNQSSHSLEDEEACDYRELETREDRALPPPDDKPTVSSCCLCCNLGLGTILAAVGFLIFNGIYIMRQMGTLKSALKEGSSVPELAFHDGHLDAIFAFVGIALSGVAALAAFVLLFFSCCCGVAEEVGKVKLGAFSWTVATGLCSIWILGEAIYRTVPQEESTNAGMGYIIVTNLYDVENPVDEETKQLVFTWLLAGAYLLLYMYFSVVVMSFVHVLSRTSTMSQKDHIAVRQGIDVNGKSDSPSLSYTTDTSLLQRQFSQMGFPAAGHPGFQNFGYAPEMGHPEMGHPGMHPELMQQHQLHGIPGLPPMFSEQIVSGPNGEMVQVVVDPNGQIVPPEIVHQIIMQNQAQMGLHPQAIALQPTQSECASVITDCTYRSGAPLVANDVLGQPVERRRSVRFQEHPQTRYIQENGKFGELTELNTSEDNASSSEEMSSTSTTSANSGNSNSVQSSTSGASGKKGVTFNMFTEEVETSPYPAEAQKAE